MEILLIVLVFTIFVKEILSDSMRKLLFSLFVFHFTLLSSCYAQTWDSVGSGLGVDSKNYIYGINTLFVYNGNLVAGGYFDTIEKGISVTGIAQWDGISWDSLKSGVEYPSVLSGYNGNLVALGYFPALPPIGGDLIGQWNGSNWDTLGSGLRIFFQWTQLNSLCEYAGDLYASGNFSYLINSNYTGSWYLGKWNGTYWDSVISDGENIVPVAMVVYNDKLYFGGGFNYHGMHGIAAWNDTTLSALGSGINSVNGYIEAMAVYNGKLYVGGAFDSAGGGPAKNIAVWDGTTWSALGSGTNNYISALTTFGNVLIAGGTFDTAGGIACKDIAQWDGSVWSALGKGIRATKYTNQRFSIKTLCAYNGALYVGGEFDSAGGKLIYNIARWVPAPETDTVPYYIGTSVTMYPNPSNGSFNVGVPGSGSATVKIYDALGREIYSSPLTEGVSNQINLVGKAAGVYLYKVLSEDGSSLGEGKLIIQK